MILSAHQLHYLPWLRYFHKIAESDVFVVMDNIQFNKNGWQNRNKIKCSSGWMYLTIPIYNKFQQRIDEVKIDNTQNWRSKHWNALLCNYSKAPYFKEYKSFFEGVFSKDWDSLNDINYEMFYFYLDVLGIKTKIVKASDLNIEGKDTVRLANICKALGADPYHSGAYALEVYLDEKVMNDAGIKVTLQDWHCPQYEQQFMKAGFVPDLAIVDLIFNHGPKSADIILK
ncbi:MAG: WbqC family protein [Candidatus Omnitrophica bacterium]|nr:WbqC family protein [Candidatus Omnitrophota bacterium]MBU1869071.1 WbqC family protein [Candidatus Omnitrophota bacterium]